MSKCNPPHVFADTIITVPGIKRRRATCRATGICRGLDKSIVVILAEVRSNPGASLAELTEVFAWYAGMAFGIAVECVTWVEHYPRHGPKDETFDVLEFGVRSPGQRTDSLGPPNWYQITREELETMIGCRLGPMLQKR